MPTFTDQTGHTITLPQVPSRIVSLVPSQTELLYDLGLNDRVVGITKFCIHPDEWFRTKVRVGGTKDLRYEMIDGLQPDLIIANKEENVKEQVDKLAMKYNVWTSDICDLASSLSMINAVGEMTGTFERANSIASKIQQKFSSINIAQKRSAIYLIWRNPYMTAGGDTFIHEMMKFAGFDNMMAGEKRYPEITIDTIRELRPAVLLLSSEPFPFSRKHIDELRPLLPATEIMLVDGEMFSWYGSRLLHAPAYFEELNK